MSVVFAYRSTVFPVSFLHLTSISPKPSPVSQKAHKFQAEVGHEATVSKVGDDQLFYLMSCGLDESESYSSIVNGFIEPITKELPMEYGVELNHLIQLEMSGSVG